MAHRLTQAELSRFHEAFTNWDITGEGTIPMRDLCRVMESLGETPSRMLRVLSAHPDAQDQSATFEEFLTVTVGPRWDSCGHETEDKLIKEMGQFDDGTGYIPLRDVMRVVHKYLDESGYHLTDGDLVHVYRQALDESFFATGGGKLAPENMWNVFEEEFTGLRMGKKTENVSSAIAGGASRMCFGFLACLRFAHTGPVKRFRQLWSHTGWRSIDSDTDWERAGETASERTQMINVTVVDLGGTPLMCDAIAAKWSVQALQQHIETVVGVPVHRQCLFLARDDGFRHELCPSGACLSEAGVEDGSTVVLVVKEAKLDYKLFIRRFKDVDLEHPRAPAQAQGRGA